MKILLRLVITYAVVEALYGSAHQYLVYIVVFSLLTEVDQIPRLLRRRGKPPPSSPAPVSRSRFHEIYGLILLSAGVSIAFAICEFWTLCDPTIIRVIALSILLHSAADLLLCRTRPLYPYSDLEVSMRAPLSDRDPSPEFVHHRKRDTVRAIRNTTDRLLLWLPLPRVNPNHVSSLSLLTSIAFVMTVRHSFAASLVLLTLTVLLDWLDGVIAQKYDLCSKDGYIVDVSTDRISEGIIFVPFFFPWFYFFLLNSILTLFGVASKKHLIFALRQIFLIVFLVGHYL